MIAAAAAALLGQAPPAPPAFEQIEAAAQALHRGLYLEAVDRARALAFRADGRFDSALGWYWLQIHPFVGGTFDPAVSVAMPPMRPIGPEIEARARRAEVRRAIPEIVARAGRTNLVILNEDHRYPRSRAFALEVARALRPLGYSILAAEAFDNHPPGSRLRPMADLARQGFARRHTGSYVQEPVFADFVRQSLALGYRPAAYEHARPISAGSELERIRIREQGQAENLATLLRANPGAKILVFVGHSHVAEEPIHAYGGREQWMAARLKRMTGIDPLTIDQNVADELDPRARAWRGLFAPRMRGLPSILVIDGAPAVEWEYRGAVDLQVVHPPLRLFRGRPDWMRRIGRRAVAIPRRLLPATGRRLVQAFVADEPADAIPLDQIVVEAGRSAPPLMLPPGRRIRWAVQDPIALPAR